MDWWASEQNVGWRMSDGVVDTPFTVMTAVLKTTTRQALVTSEQLGKNLTKAFHSLWLFAQSRELACLGSDFGKTLNSRACFAFDKAFHRPTTHEYWNVQGGPKIISKQSVLSLFFT